MRVLAQGDHNIRLNKGDFIDLRKCSWDVRCNTPTRTSEDGASSFLGVSPRKVEKGAAEAERN